MATLKQKEELIEAFKGPFYYNVRLWGYGGEQSFMKISEDAYKFWKAHVEEEGDAEAVQYVINAEDYNTDEVNDDEDLEITVPREAMFMHDEEGEGSTYYEPIDQLEGTWCPGVDAVWLAVTQVDSAEYMANDVKDIIEREEVGDYISRVQEESDYEAEVYKSEHDYGDVFAKKGQCIAQFVSSEKGTFFDATIETSLPFNQNLLEFAVAEAPDGEDLIYAVYYDGEELDNNGGDTTGKGYSCYFWKQEF